LLYIRRSALATVTLLLFVLTACSLLPPLAEESAPPALSHFDGQGVSFDYPAEWAAAHFDVTSNFSSSIVYLSTSPLSDPCDRAPNSIQCTWAAASGLAPDGLLVEWSRNGWPGWTFDPTKGQPINVSGRAATIEDLPAVEPCQSIGGERQLVVTIDDPVADQNWTEVRACLRGPNLAGLSAQIGAMLESVRWQR
jgi:hypothetical protein